MKFLLIICLFVLSVPAHAGRYAHDFNVYDQSTNFFYITSKIDDQQKGNSFLSKAYVTRSSSDIYIYDTAKESGKLLFGDGKDRVVTALMFEESFTDLSADGTLGKVSFGGTGADIRNNRNIAVREIKNRLLVEVEEGSGNLRTTSLWVAQKNGSGLTRLVAFESKKQWHLDVKNSKIRIIDKNAGNISITNIPW